MMAATGEAQVTLARPDVGAEPMAVIIMGVSGCGKSTLGTRVAAALGCPFLEGDAFHSPAAIAKMASGHPLSDEDRRPWLARLGEALGEAARADGVAVAACSALKQAYRDRLCAAAAMPIRFVLLDADRRELARRLEKRRGHYMPVSLLDSQLDTLERPAPDEHALVLAAGGTPDAILRATLAWLGGPPADR